MQQFLYTVMPIYLDPVARGSDPNGSKLVSVLFNIKWTPVCHTCLRAVGTGVRGMGGNSPSRFWQK